MLVQLLKHMFNARLTYVILFLSVFLIGLPAEALQAQHRKTSDLSFKELMQQAQQKDTPADWQRVIENARNRRDTADLGLAYISYYQSYANRIPSGNLVRETDSIFSFFSKARQYDYYFILYNLCITRWFSNREYDQVEKAITRMFEKAREFGQPIGMAMAFRVQGQTYYKLRFYDRAFTAFEKGLQTCPSYKESLNAFSTVQSLCEWQMMTCLKQEALQALEELSDYYAEMVDYWSAQGWKDNSGHFMATRYAFQAISRLKAGDMSTAQTYLQLAEACILPHFPARAYEHFYEARILYNKQTGEYGKALSDVNILLDAHQGYFPFYLDDILAKAEILTLGGHEEESVSFYEKYIAAADSIAHEEISYQLEELKVRYEVEKGQLESQQKTRLLGLSWVILFLITLALIIYITYAYKLRANKRLLVARLQEYDKWAKTPQLWFLAANKEVQEKREEKTSAISKDSDSDVIERLKKYMMDERPFLNPALQRKDMAQYLQINERVLASLIRETFDQSVLEYITSYRLEYACHLLSANESLPLKDIAQQCGFGTLRTFQRLFHDRYGMPPSQYRGFIRDRK